MANRQRTQPDKITDHLTSTSPTPRSPREVCVFNAAQFGKQYLAIAPHVFSARFEHVQGDLTSDGRTWVMGEQTG